MPTPPAPDDLGFVETPQSAHDDLGFQPAPETPSADPRAALAQMNDAPGHPTIRGLLDMLPGSHKFIAAADAAKDALTSDAKFTPSYEKHLAETDALYNQERQDPRFRIGQAAGVLAMPVSSAKGMAALGAAAGAGDARGDFAHTLEGAGLGGAVGAATGLAGPVISKAASSAAPYLDQLAIKMGRKALSGGGAISVAKPLSDEAVREALDSGAIKFGGTVTGAADRLDGLRSGVGDQYGKIVTALKGMGIEGPEADVLAQKMVAEGRSVSATSMNPAASGAYEQAAAQIASKPVNANGRLALDQAESLKRSAQDMAKSAYRKLEPGEVGDAHMGVASMLRQANEDAIEQGAQASGNPMIDALAKQFVPVKQRLGNLIEAGNVADQAASRAGRNKSISLTDTIAGAAGLSHGAGGAFAAMTGNKLLRTRGPSTAASVLSSASKLANLAQTQPAVLGKFAAPLQQAAARGADAVAATHFTLTQDPAYQELMHRVAENDQ